MTGKRLSSFQGLTHQELIQNIRPGEYVDTDLALSLTTMPGECQEIDEGVNYLQSSVTRFENTLGSERLYETFYRDNSSEPFRYMGLCQRDEMTNRHPRSAVRVFIISAFKARTEEDRIFNVNFARAVARTEYLNGFFPIVPHLLIPQYVNDNDPYERSWGIEAGHVLMESCDEVLVAIVGGRISEGMKSDIEYATERLAIKPETAQFTRREAETLIQKVGISGL